MSKYRSEEDNSGRDVSFDIFDGEGDDADIIATVGSPIEADNLVNHLNNPRGEYTMAENPEGKNYRYAVSSEQDDEVLAFFRIRESAEGILSHLNRNN